MERDEFDATIRHINAEIRTIIKNQQVLADIHERVEKRNRDPLEEDFIEADVRGAEVGEPRILSIDGVQIVVRKLHRRGIGSADIAGADLLYEIVGRKFALIQYKTPNAQSRVSKDADQLDTLMASCPNPCPPPNSPLYCGGWHCVINAAGSLYHPACVADEIFGQAKSRHEQQFKRGLSKNAFDEGFAKCWIGARTHFGDISYATWAVTEANHLLVLVRQFGNF